MWAFVAVDHYTAEDGPRWPNEATGLRAWSRSTTRSGNRFGAIGPDVARGIAMRHDWGPQYTSGHFQGALRWLGIEDSPAYVGEPPCNGCAERFIRTLKEQCIWARTYADVADSGRPFGTPFAATTPSADRGQGPDGRRGLAA